MVFVICLNTDYGFEIPDLFVVGYALDYNEYFRDLNVSLFKKKQKSLFYCFWDVLKGSFQWV